ncbi:hypothetical protein NAT65_32010, partial [Achromobacter xylosoxidans]|uniref:hypothetical protein n=1 Tax=Alcaligenes xylosoxydans xylosoxydans TaxID=85698 RepID=UPI00203C2712
MNASHAPQAATAPPRKARRAGRALRPGRRPPPPRPPRRRPADLRPGELAADLRYGAGGLGVDQV